jgi:hypothetical protein
MYCFGTRPRNSAHPIIAAVKGTIGIRRRSESTSDSGDFKTFRAISNAGTKNIIADET